LLFGLLDFRQKPPARVQAKFRERTVVGRVFFSSV
jgi:hypothetical protein